MIGRASQPRECGCRGRRFGRIVIDPDLGERVDHRPGREKVFHREALAAIGTRRSGRH